MKDIHILFLALSFGWFNVTAQDSSYQSEIVYYNPNGNLAYEKDTENNRIPDFSYAGYQGGGVELPFIANVDTLGPIEGDNTQHIQAAIDAIASQDADANGFRGALFLRPGYYQIDSTIDVNAGGIVLRGAGDDQDSTLNTVLFRPQNGFTGPLVIAGSGVERRWSDEVANTQTNITKDVWVGEYDITVADASAYAAGDVIVIEHPSTEDWLRAIDFGGTATASGWNVGEQRIRFLRRVKSIQDSVITLDVPVYNHLDLRLTQPFIYKLDLEKSQLLSQIGIEHIRFDIKTESETAENHARNAVELTGITDSWVTHCTALHYVLSGFITYCADRITIQDCRSLEPHSIITGARRYNFNAYRNSSQILFERCYATYGRHHFVVNGASTASGIVFLDCEGKGAYNTTEGHRKWSTGILYDNLIETEVDLSRENILALYNRGDYGSGHGWSAAHSVAWNCNVDGNVIIQKPPTAQNYAIGCIGDEVTGKAPPAPFDQPEGYIEGANTPGIYPTSLYRAQLLERKKEDPADQRYIYNFMDDSDLSTSSSAFSQGYLSYQVTECEELKLQVQDMENNPFPGSTPVIFNPTDENGDEVTNLSATPNVYLRVRSAAPFSISVLLRSGDGTSNFRTQRVTQEISTTNINEWAELAFDFDSATWSASGFDPNDFRDLWIYLDRDNPNFPGNEIYIDYLTIDEFHKPALYTPCNPQFWANTWEDADQLSSSSAFTDGLIDYDITVCNELKLFVPDPDNSPLPGSKPIIINPKSDQGEELSFVSFSPTIYARVRSAGEVPLSFLLRSNDGSSAYRTDTVTRTVSAGLEQWTTLAFTFTEADFANNSFDPDSLRDIWFYPDRGADNFNGNELYFDYITLDLEPTDSLNNACSVIPPEIAALNPDFGAVGDEVSISGTDFNQTQQVLFGEVESVILQNTATQIVTRVPVGADMAPVTVVTPAGEAISEVEFEVLIKPEIISFTPLTGPVGSEVTISGNYFRNVQSVTIAGYRADIISSTAEEIVAEVPNGAQKGKISVTTRAGSVVSVEDFEVVEEEPPITGLSALQSKVSIYPQPSSDYFSFESEFPVQQVEVVDLQGIIRYQHNYQLPLHRSQVIHGLKDGFYFIRLSGEGNRVLIRLVISD